MNQDMQTGTWGLNDDRKRVADEQDWIPRLRQRDASVLEAIYAHFGTPLYRVALRLLRDTAAAEDVVQETLARFWRVSEDLNNTTASVGPLLFTIARNRALDHLRARASQTRFRQALRPEATQTDYPNPDSQFLSHESQVIVEGAVKRLDPNQRCVIEMAYFEGLTQSQIAERLHQPLGTVKSWSRSALTTLRQEISFSFGWRA